MLVLKTDLETLKNQLACGVHDPYKATWDEYGKMVHVLSLWGYHMPGKEHAVKLRFEVEGGNLKLAGCFIDLRSDGLLEVTPEQHLEQALELQGRVLTWLEKRPYARQISTD